MSRAARSVFVWGVYMIFSGTLFILFPNLLLPMMHMQVDKEPWLLAGSSLIVIFGFYYIVAARHEEVPFFRATIWGRFALLVWYMALFIIHRTRWELVLIAVPDQFGALWTWIELRRAADEAEEDVIPLAGQ